MKLYFLLARRVPPVPSQIVLEVSEILRCRGFRVESGIAEEMLVSPDQLASTHDLYLLKSYTALSLSLAGVLHAEGARLLNPYPGCLASRDKIIASKLLRAAGIPAPRCWVTADLKLLGPIVEETPLLIKPHMGWRGEGIHIVRNRRELAAVPQPQTPLLIQEYLQGTGEGLRMYVAGDQIFAVLKRFSSASSPEPGQPCAVTPELRDIALCCGRAFGLGLYCVDLIETPNGFKVVDVNDFPDYKGAPDAAVAVADYIEGFATRWCSLQPSEMVVPTRAPHASGPVGLFKASGKSAEGTLKLRMLKTDLGASRPIPRLICSDCSSDLVDGAGKVVCPQCGRSWPILDGIPRFSQPSYYWGDLPQRDAARLLSEARELGWREALLRQFAGDEDRLFSVVNWQRATWLSLLGLGRDAVALDLGSEYGAITHSLAHLVAEVYSVEAIPERIEFTQTRLQQEGISNVHLLQDNAVAPRFPNNSFDLIVVNGVLEWVGEWETKGHPRVAQARFLSRLHRLLKDTGVVVIGVENRFGYNALFGGIDHSGLPTTSLMPRFLASLYQRYSRRLHHRASLNPEKPYRTYIHSERGYRKLLAESGFASADFYWADPGYNRPYTLVPLVTAPLQEHLRAKLSDPSQRPRSRRRRLAKALWFSSGLKRSVISDFVILAEKGVGLRRPLSERLSEHVRAAVPQGPNLAEPVLTLSTNQFSKKNVVRVFESGGEKPRFILKTSTPAPGSQEAVQSEFRGLTLVRQHLRSQINPPFFVPEPLGSFSVGSLLYTVESVAAEQSFSRLICAQPRHHQLEYLRRELPRCINAARQLALMLRGEATVERVRDIDPGMWGLLPEFMTEPSLQRLLHLASSVPLSIHSGEGDWVQHGSFTVENLFLEPSSGKLTVTDWGHLTRGVPPLYDVFSLLLSVVPTVVLEKEALAPAENLLERQFLAAFFGQGPWVEFFQKMILTACQWLASPPALVWEMFLQFLFLRIQHFLLQGRPLTRRQTQFLHPMMHNLVRFVHLALRHSGQFLLPPDQWRQRGAHQAYGANCSPEAPGRAIEMPARRSAEVSEE